MAVTELSQATCKTIKPEQLSGQQFCTYRIGGMLQEAYQPVSLEEAIAVLNQNREAILSDTPFTVLGWGGNTLIASAGLSGVTLITRKMNWVKQFDETTFEFGAGVHLAKVSTTAYTHGLTGAEFMIGIPGTAGGAVRMNAGALGQETSALVVSAQVYDLQTGLIEVWEQARFAFAYRKSALDPKRYVVLSVVFRFQPGDKTAVKALMDQSVQFRKSHHPTEPNGGSVFKNPNPDNPVGRLIDQLGGKAWVEGGARISPLHANFIVNVNQATSLDILKLMLRMKTEIKTHYGFDTHPENIVMGDLTPEEKAILEALNA